MSTMPMTAQGAANTACLTLSLVWLELANSRMILMLTSTNSSKTYAMGSWALRTGDASTAP